MQLSTKADQAMTLVDVALDLFLRIRGVCFFFRLKVGWANDNFAFILGIKKDPNFFGFFKW